MANIKMADLIDWLDPTKTNHGGSPFNRIPSAEGIYKVYVLDQDKDYIKFGKVKMKNNKQLVNTKLSNPQCLQEVFDSNSEPNKNHVLYIGKANKLRRRIKQYVKTVFGGKNHKGGIDIWAVQDYEKYLHMEWFDLDRANFDTARKMEEKEIEKFKGSHNGNRPLANRQD